MELAEEDVDRPLSTRLRRRQNGVELGSDGHGRPKPSPECSTLLLSTGGIATAASDCSHEGNKEDDVPEGLVGSDVPGTETVRQ